MIYSLNYQSKNRSSAQEIRCPYNQLGTIFSFIKDNPNKRYNIIVPKDANRVDIKKAIEQVDIIKDIVQDYTIQCGSLYQLYDVLNEGYKAYLQFPVSDWETFQNLRDLEVSDIYIDGPLGFQINAISAIKNDIKIRVSPTISSNSAIPVNKAPSSFFIRPEDILLYKDMIDVIDFKEPNQDKEDALYSIYKRGSFNYDIDQLITGLPADVNNLMFKQDFASNRLNCGQKCKIPGHSCHSCETYFHIIQQLVRLV